MLLSAPTWTSPMTWALMSTNADGWTVGRIDRYGRSIQLIIECPKCLRYRPNQRSDGIHNDFRLIPIDPVAAPFGNDEASVGRRCRKPFVGQSPRLIAIRRSPSAPCGDDTDGNGLWKDNRSHHAGGVVQSVED